MGCQNGRHEDTEIKQIWVQNSYQPLEIKLTEPNFLSLNHENRIEIVCGYV